MSLTLAITDNADGTGATASVTGTSGAGVTVYTQPSGGAFSAAASRTGDGTIALPGLGYFWAYALLSSGLGSPSTILLYGATAGTLSCLRRCQDAIAAILSAKTFAPLDNGNVPTVTTRKASQALDVGLPVCVVSIEGLSQSPSGKPWDSEGHDLTGYPVGVGFLDVSAALAQDADQYTLWRETAELAVQNRFLPGASEVYTVKVSGGPAVESSLSAAWGLPTGQAALRSGFVAMCQGIRSRG